MNQHVYIGIENLALSAGQKSTLVTALEALGQANAGSSPAQRNHWRTRLDNDAVIFEALFDEDAISIDAIKQRLANIFGVGAGEISHATSQPAYGLLVTYTHSATDYLRLIAFGYAGGWPSWEQSRQAVKSYLAANAVAWGDA